MSTNSERIALALDYLTDGMAPYVEGKLRAIYRKDWARQAASSFRSERGRPRRNGDHFEWDAHSLLTVMWDHWNSLFRHDLGHYERSLVSELREYRNRWAHQQDFDFADTFRVLDSVRRLLDAVHADNVAEVTGLQNSILESHVADAVNTQIQRTAFQRNKWWVIAIYTACCSMIVWHMLTLQRAGANVVASITVLTLLYLIYQQFKMEPPVYYGPHECSRCHRIIYGNECPYCPKSLFDAPSIATH